jgi:putative transposase
MEIFFFDEDYQAYLALMVEWCRQLTVTIWCYCLMPTHLHLIAVPEKEEGTELFYWKQNRINLRTSA